MTSARVLTAVVLVPGVLAVVLLAPTAVVAGVVALVTLGALREFFALGAKAGLGGHPRWTMAAAAGLIYAQWARSSAARWDISGEEVLLVFVLGAAALALAGPRAEAEALRRLASSAAGLLFVALPLSCLVGLHAAPGDGSRRVLLVLAVVWAGDTAAYFAGRALGRRPLAPAISPKKTWEGAIAHVAASMGAAAAFVWFLPVPLAHLVVLGIVVSAAAQLGDLLESAYKRAAGVKDSGTLLPGHGGILDRVDALILAAPVVWWYFEWVTRS